MEKCVHTLKGARACLGLLLALGLGCQGGAPGEAGLSGETRLVKLSPRSLRLLEPSSLEEGDSTLWKLFDRSISQGFTPPASSGQDAVIEVALEAPSFLRFLKVFGAAPYTLRVEKEDGSALPGLEEVDLSTLPNTSAWNILLLSSPSMAKSVRLRFSSQGVDAVIPEVELWAEGEAYESIPSLTSFSLEKLKEEKAQYSSRYTAIVGEPDELVLTPLDAPLSLEIAGPGVPCGVATFSLEQDPSLFSRVYLAYEANIFRPWVLKRSVNGGLFVGGSMPVPPQEVSLPFVEELDPERFSLGINSVEFCLPSGMTREVAVKNIRLLAEKETGRAALSPLLI